MHRVANLYFRNIFTMFFCFWLEPEDYIQMLEQYFEHYYWYIIALILLILKILYKIHFPIVVTIFVATQAVVQLYDSYDLEKDRFTHWKFSPYKKALLLRNFGGLTWYEIRQFVRNPRYITPLEWEFVFWKGHSFTRDEKAFIRLTYINPRPNHWLNYESPYKILNWNVLQCLRHPDVILTEKEARFLYWHRFAIDIITWSFILNKCSFYTYEERLLIYMSAMESWEITIKFHIIIMQWNLKKKNDDDYLMTMNELFVKFFKF